MPTTPAYPDATRILTHWFGSPLLQDWPDSDRNSLWFGGGPSQDQLIREQFGDLVDEALAGRLLEWEGTAAERLALILLLDQFSRNVHRGTALAFAGDARAQALVLQSLALEHDQQLPTVARVFLYMPLMHAEDLALQVECVKRFQQLHDSRTGPVREALAGNLKAAREHQDIVARFGRFPHRNAALGREPTPEETAFMKVGPRFGQ